MVTIYTDAAGAPHNIYGYYILERNEERFIRSKFKLDSIEAEFLAIIEALNSNTVRSSKQITIYSDSASVIEFINRKAQTRKGTVVRLLTIQILNITDNMEEKPYFIWIPREHNLAGILIEDEIPKKINKNLLFRESLLR
jgi:ribonuclease HI